PFACAPLKDDLPVIPGQDGGLDADVGPHDGQDATPLIDAGDGSSEAPPRLDGAAPGTLDPTFGDKGWAVVRTPLDAAQARVISRGLVVLPAEAGASAGEIVALGVLSGVTDKVLVRLSKDGQTDPSFGGGLVFVPGKGPGDDLYHVVRDSRGRLVVSG